VTVPGDTEEAQLEKLKERMLNRLENEPTEKDWEHIKQRLDRAGNLEFPFAKTAQHVIVNDDIEHAAEEIDAIIKNAIANRSAEVTKEQEL
jgi:guanylate kinase